MFTVICYLVVEGSPLRGDVEKTNFKDSNVSGRHFLNTFSNLLFPLNKKLGDLSRRLPDNAKYTSPMIQHEVVKVLNTVVRRKIVDGCKKSGSSKFESLGIICSIV